VIDDAHQGAIDVHLRVGWTRAEPDRSGRHLRRVGPATLGVAAASVISSEAAVPRIRAVVAKPEAITVRVVVRVVPVVRIDRVVRVDRKLTGRARDGLTLSWRAVARTCDAAGSGRRGCATIWSRDTRAGSRRLARSAAARAGLRRAGPRSLRRGCR